MDQYERIFRRVFGESLTAQTMFVLALVVFVGVPYLVRTWRELKFAKHRVDLSRSEIELLSALFHLAEKVGTAEDVAAIRETAKERLRATLQTLRATKKPASHTEFERQDPGTLQVRMQVTGLLILGSLLSFLTTVFIPGLGLLVMLIVAAVCIATGRLRGGSIQRRAFYSGLTYVTVGELLILIIWGIGSSP